MCHPASRSNITDSRAYVLPSVPLTKLFKLMRRFPYHHAFVGAESRNGKELETLSTVLLEVFESVRNQIKIMAHSLMQ